MSILSASFAGMAFRLPLGMFYYWVVVPVVALVGAIPISPQGAGVMEVTADDYDTVTDVVLRGTLHMSQAVIPGMKARGQGSIVCVSSMSAQQGGGVFGGAHYCAAKAGVLGLVRAMARELGPDGIRVNAVTPGLILTDFSRGANSDENKHALVGTRSGAMHRLGDAVEVRLVEAAPVAGALRFELLTNAASAPAGQRRRSGGKEGSKDRPGDRRPERKPVGKKTTRHPSGKGASASRKKPRKKR